MDYLTGSSAQATSNTDVAAALGVLVPMREDKRLEKTSGAVEQVTFYFEAQSECGQFQTVELIRAWDDKVWQRDRPRHPWSYLRVFFQNRHRLRDMRSKGVQLAATWREEKMELVTVRGDLRGQDKVPSPAPGTDAVETDSDDVAAALMAVGVPLWTSNPWRRGGANGIVYRFHSVSPCGRMSAAALSLAWEQEDWWTEHREHPFAYPFCAARNHAFLTKLVKQKPPLVVMMRQGLPCFLPANADPAVEGRFFREFNKG